MYEILYLVNNISSTSIPVEIGHAINQRTNSTVTIGSLVQDSNAVLDPDIQEMDLCTVFSSESENFDARMYWRVWRHLNEHEYDVIHTHQNFSGAIGRIIAEMRNIPVVNTEHNDIQHFTLPQRLINAATFGLPKANIYNSRSTKKSCGSVEWHFSRCDEIIYNGIDIDRISKSGETQYSTEFQDNILITNVVVMTQQKNQHMILRTVRRIKHCSEITGVHFSIVGSGPLEDKLKLATIELGVGELVTFTGYLPRREEVYALLHQSDIFLTPSKYEEFCVAAVEAMTCESVVVASDIGVLRDTVYC